MLPTTVTFQEPYGGIIENSKPFAADHVAVVMTGMVPSITLQVCHDGHSKQVM